MSRMVRLIVAAVVLLATRTASAQVMCNDAAKLPNPIVVSGSIAFEPTLRQFAAKLAAEPSPTTIIYTGSTPSCAGVGDVLSGKDLGGAPGRYYFFLDATTIDFRACTFAAGQKADVAVSDVFYESCASLPQPRPADVIDVLGPVQPSIFVMPSASSVTRYLTYAEAQVIYGCGVSAARAVVGLSDPAQVFCRDPSVGQQVVVAKNLGLSPSTLVSPTCVDGVTAAALIGALASSTSAAVGFVVADNRDYGSAGLTALAFQSLGQTQAYYLDANSGLADRRNVRDGHYTIWGYEHLIAKTAGGANLGGPAGELAAWVNGTKTSTNLDHLLVETGAGLIPQCAMKVKRSADGGALSPYAPSAPCHCAFEAIVSQSIPAGCVACTTSSQCAAAKNCRRGFCE